LNSNSKQEALIAWRNLMPISETSPKSEPAIVDILCYKIIASPFRQPVYTMEHQDRAL
jgi:hypothetical protein